MSKPAVARSRYLARGISVCMAGWLAHAFLATEAQSLVPAFGPVLVALMFMGLDRYMLRSCDRLAERLSASIGQLLIVLSVLFASAALFAETPAWPWPVVWLCVATAALTILDLYNDRILSWRPATSSVLLIGDDPQSVGLPRQEAFEWLNDEQNLQWLDEVRIVEGRLSDSELLDLLHALQRRDLKLSFPSSGGQPSTARPALTAASKRLFDIVCSSVLLCCCAPLMLVIALAIRLQDGGPVLFRQQRLGLDGRCVTILKFRSMQVEAGNDPLAPQARDRDPRITRLGHWIRLWGIDELPQLLNVLTGDMSMVGPRPHAVAHDLTHGASIADYYQRQATRPGITGLAQVRGMRGETRSAADMQLRVGSDLEYITRQSLLLDLLILVATPLALLNNRQMPGLLQNKKAASWASNTSLMTSSEAICPDAIPHADNHCEGSRVESA